MIFTVKQVLSRKTRCYCSYFLGVVTAFVIVTIVVVEGIRVVVVIPVYVRVAVVIYRMVALVAFLAHSINRCLL